MKGGFFRVIPISDSERLYASEDGLSGPKLLRSGKTLHLASAGVAGEAGGAESLLISFVRRDLSRDALFA